jgi:hypothetical protein
LAQIVFVLHMATPNQMEVIMIKTICTAFAIILASSSLTIASTAPQFDEPTFKSTHDTYQQDARSKKRIPGGSGCDDAADYAQHPECRG